MSIAWRRRNPWAGGGRLPTVAIALGLLAGLVFVAGCLMSPPATRRSGPASGNAANASTPTVRVRVLAGVTSAELVVNGAARVVDASMVREDKSLAPTDGRPVAVNGKKYRGSLTLVPAGPNAFDVVNVVTIDEYLDGVVPSEAFPTWPAEALKAQAIASRTYALYQIKSRNDGARHYDLHSDVRSQAYGGVEKEVPATSDAVAATRGVVLASGPRGDERIFCAYFSSTCGGTGASGLDVFDDPTPALAPRSADGCADAPRHRWPEFAIRKDELTRRVRVYGQRNALAVANVGPIRTVEVAARNALGRPSRFAITDEAGRRFELDAEPMRNAANADGPKDPQFLSSFFTPVDAGDGVRITDGHGWGHGVGMCQYCAFGWSRRGDDARAILAASYPGAVLVRGY